MTMVRQHERINPCLLLVMCLRVSGNYTCNTKCEIPWLFNNYTYNGCTLDFYGKPWCITNQAKFDEIWKQQNGIWTTTFFDSIEVHLGGTSVGWEYCSQDCTLESKICSECDFPFLFKGREYHGCAPFSDEQNMSVKNHYKFNLLYAKTTSDFQRMLCGLHLFCETLLFSSIFFN